MLLTKDLLREITLIVTDIDGTILNDTGELGWESKKLIKELMKENVIITLATGRLHSAVLDTAKEISLNGYIISLDGAMIKSYVDDKIIYESFLKPGQVKKAISMSEELLVNIALCHASTIYYTEHNSVIPKLLGNYGAFYTQIEKYEGYLSGTLEVICSSDIKKSIRQIEEKFSFPYDFGCDISYFRSKRNENIYYLEIRKAGSSKGKAVKRLIKNLALKPQQTAVIGDWYNDVPMFQTNVIKVAVANAVPELLNTAHFITTNTNQDDGTAEFFEMVLKSKRDYK